MKDNFCHLHVHSSYSFTDGYGLPEQYIARAKELGQPGIGVTDHGNISVHYKWYKQSNKAGLKPVLGCEFYIVESLNQVYEREYGHITVLVKNNTGYTNLTKLATKASCDQFYYKPRITFQDLFDHQEGLIVLSGCLSSPIMKLLKANNIQAAYTMISLFKNKIRDFYIEVQPISSPEGIDAYRRLIKLYKEKLEPAGMKWVATNDCHYVLKEQAKVQEILLCIQTGTVMSNPDRMKFDSNDYFLKSRNEMEQSFREIYPESDFNDALDMSVEIMNMVDFTFPKSKPISYPMPEEHKAAHLQKMCYSGMKKRGFTKIPMYKDRLDYEIDLIIKKNFVDYFLVIADLVQWSKNNGILVGPARGSAAGSLACYALAITEVEPIKYDLMFERFIDLNREDLPDIDLDFEDVRRHEVKEYLESKYGRDKVGNLPTFSQFKGRSSIDDIGRVFNIPFSVLDKVKNAIIERSGGDSRASFTLEDTFTSSVFEYPKEAIKEYPELHYAVDLEGQYRQMGQHAAGVVISNTPITDFCSLNKVKDSYVISMDYKDASDTGLLKIDILGLNTLSVISHCLRQIKERHNIKIDMYTLPLDDEAVYQGFCDGKLFGVFQFDGQALNQVCRQIMPRNFEQMQAISALARPGPLNSGSTTMYINRKAGREPITYPHPIMESYTKETYGIVIYQEQVMKTMREVGKMSWKDTAEIRKLISKSQGVEKFNTFKDKFSVGAIENGLTNDQIDAIWDSICTFGSWAFNKSHSVSYGMISYWTMWLKIHYPLEFYSSIMALTEYEEKKTRILKEYRKEGHAVLPVDINRSKEHFSIDEDGLRIGFTDIRGIGPSAAVTLVKNQPYKTYTDFELKTYKKRITKTIKENLINLGAFDSVGNRAIQEDLFGELQMEYYKRDIGFGERFIICPWDMDFGLDKNWLPLIKDRPDKFRNMPIPISSLEDMQGQKDIVIYGMVYDKNLKDAREENMSKGRVHDSAKYHIAHLLKEELFPYFRFNEWVSKGYLDGYNRYAEVKLIEGEDYIFEDQFQFANFIVEDDTDFVTVRMSHTLFPKYGKMIFEEIEAGDPIILSGNMGTGIRMFFVNKIYSLKRLKKSS